MDDDTPVIEQYGTGTIVRAANGKFLPGTRTPKPITNENARAMHERRKELTAQKMRAELVKRGRTDLLDTAGPAEIVARAAGQMWQEIVTNSKANPRYRAETWQMIGRHADLLGDARQNSPSDGMTVTIGADLARDMVQAIMAARDKSGNTR